MVEFVHMDLQEGRLAVKQDDQRKIRREVMLKFRRNQRENYGRPARDSCAIDRRQSSSNSVGEYRKIGQTRFRISPTAATYIQHPQTSSAGHIPVFLSNDVDLNILGYWFWTLRPERPTRNWVHERVPDQGLQTSWKIAQDGNQFALDTITAHAFLRKAELSGSRLPVEWYKTRGNMIRKIKHSVDLYGSEVNPSIILMMGVLAWLELRTGQRQVAHAHLQAIRGLVSSRAEPGPQQTRKHPEFIDQSEWMSVTLAFNRLPQAFREEPIDAEAIGGTTPLLEDVLLPIFTNDQIGDIAEKSHRNADASPALVTGLHSTGDIGLLFQTIHALESLGKGQRRSSTGSDIACAGYNMTIIHDRELSLLQNAISRRRNDVNIKAFELIIIAIELSTWIARRPHTNTLLTACIKEILQQSGSDESDSAQFFIRLWLLSQGTSESLLWTMIRIVGFYLQIQSFDSETLQNATAILKQVLLDLEITIVPEVETVLQDWPILQGDNFASLQEILEHTK